MLDDVIDVLLLAHHFLGSKPRKTRPGSLRGATRLQSLVLLQLLFALLHFGDFRVSSGQKLVEGVDLKFGTY